MKSIYPQLKKGQLLILESTSYPGTTREELCEKLYSKFRLGKEFFVGFSSERINPGINDNVLKTVTEWVNACDKYGLIELVESILPNKDLFQF